MTEAELLAFKVACSSLLKDFSGSTPPRPVVQCSKLNAALGYPVGLGKRSCLRCVVSGESTKELTAEASPVMHAAYVQLLRARFIVASREDSKYPVDEAALFEKLVKAVPDRQVQARILLKMLRQQSVLAARKVDVVDCVVRLAEQYDLVSLVEGELDEE